MAYVVGVSRTRNSIVQVAEICFLLLNCVPKSTAAPTLPLADSIEAPNRGAPGSLMMISPIFGV